MSSKKKYAVAVMTIVFSLGVSVASLFVFHDVLGFTSSNSALYVLKGRTGGIEITRDMLVEDKDRLIFMLDANCVYNYFMIGLAKFSKRPLLELTYDEEQGTGDIKQYRPDGKMLEVTFSRFFEGAKPHGLFMGGDLPYGDTSRDETRGTSGMSYYNGAHWNHIWCAINEAFNLSGSDEMVEPTEWKYLGSRRIKDTYDEVVIESSHEAEVGGKKVRMKRVASLRAVDDYITMNITISNPNSADMTFSYVFGDEPWVGKYGNSFGDVGWGKNGLIAEETAIDPATNAYAGYWDVGNEKAGEDHSYTGYANFIEWIAPMPTSVFFANGFECCKDEKPLNGIDNRVITILWENQILPAGGSASYTIALGMARFGPGGFPEPPMVSMNGMPPGHTRF